MRLEQLGVITRGVNYSDNEYGFFRFVHAVDDKIIFDWDFAVAFHLQAPVGA